MHGEMDSPVGVILSLSAARYYRRNPVAAAAAEVLTMLVVLVVAVLTVVEVVTFSALGITFRNLPDVADTHTRKKTALYPRDCSRAYIIFTQNIPDKHTKCTGARGVRASDDQRTRLLLLLL